MHSLGKEIQSFSKHKLRKQCTRVTTLSGKKIIETWKDNHVQVVDDPDQSDGSGCGYIQDLSLDLQVGVVKPWLLLGSQDVAQDMEVMKKYKVSHILNVAYGVENSNQTEFVYKKISILDLPETDITSYFPECFDFIEQANMQGGIVLVHCNAGVSRAPAIVIGFLMCKDELHFSEAFSIVKNARPVIHPNAGFMEQLHKYENLMRSSEIIYGKM
ncbi:dual specificity protein phosphatase 19 [Bombina bombina]|uniref:dual specificity protein phosphatase 19 n=1 Tax=Bombina bombina TaxID=8345 RepID=UPI00235A587B|nr:dual specificity protein phosphatase 19 [Bombina bombina]